MKLPTFIAISAAGSDAAGRWTGERPELSKEDADSFLKRYTRMNSVPGAADDSLLEEMRTGNLERECNEETCDWAEAYEILGDKAQTDDFMYNRLHQCEIKNPCFNLGTASCQNKWDSYWCQCLSGWYGKDCDFMDTKDGYMCQRATGCSSPLIAVPQVVSKEDPPPATTTSTTSTTTTTLRTQKAIALPAYEPSVECDTINDRFTVKMPLSYDGDFLLGWDMMTANCGFTSEDQQGVIYSYKFTECGTQMKLDENDANKFIYENNLSRKPVLANGVYRDYGAIYNFRCIIDRLGHVDNDFVNATTGEIIGDIMPVYVVSDNMISAMGQYENNDDFIFRLNVYSDASFSSRFKMQEFPLLKSLKERIYLGTEVITKMQHEYIFTKRCWATPSVDTDSNIAYSPIIDNGCPSDAFTSLQARSNHEDRFSTETLRFPESNYVYIQCDVIVCDLRKPNDPACQSTCRADAPTNLGPSQDIIRRKRRAVSPDSHPEQTVTLGPFMIRDQEATEDSATSSSSFWSTSFGWVVAGCATVSLVAYVSQRKKFSVIEPTHENTVM